MESDRGNYREELKQYLKNENYKIIPLYLSAESAMASQSGVSSLSLKTITVKVRRQNSQVETVALGKTETLPPHCLRYFYYHSQTESSRGSCRTISLPGDVR